MPQLLRMPEVAAGGTTAVLAAWSVAENTAYTVDDTLAEIETDKATVDLEAQADGVILKALVAAGAQVAVGDPIALIGTTADQGGDLSAMLAQLGVSSHDASTAEPANNPEPGPEVDLPDQPAPPEGPDDPADLPAPGRPPATSPAQSGSARVFASPLARRLAHDAGLSIDDLTPGTGPGGRVRRDDVQAAIAARRTAAPTASAAASPPPASATYASAPTRAASAPTGPSAQHPGYTETPHSRIRAVIAARLTESKQTVPHFYLQGSADVTALLALRAQLNAAGEVRISVNDLVIKAAARAMSEVPAMNVVWTPQALRQFSGVDMSVAIASDRGLVTPVLRAVQQMSITAVAKVVRDFAQRANSGTLKQTDLEGGSFTVTNLGMFGVEDFSAIINPPQSAILAVGAARPEPVVRDGELVAATIMRYTLSVDHRAVDGAVAAQWLRAFTAILDEPVRILL